MCELSKRVQGRGRREKLVEGAPVSLTVLDHDLTILSKF